MVLQAQDAPKVTVPLVYAPEVLADMNSTGTNADIAMQIEIYNSMTSRHVMMKEDLKKAFENFENSSDYGEAKLQHVMNLLETDLVIVKHLLCGDTGWVIEEAVMMRNDLLAHSMPSVAFMYDKILDTVMYDETTNRKLYDSGTCGRSLATALNWRHKKCFLTSMRDKIDHYLGLMRAMQCNVARDADTASRYVPVDAMGGYVSFCPVIK
jgi:hypothetical protein